jgi:hypothetical protein
MSDISQVFGVDDILWVLKDIPSNRQGETAVRFTLTASPLSIEIIDPFHGLYIADFPKISLGCRQVGVAQNHLTDNLNGDP